MEKKRLKIKKRYFFIGPILMILIVSIICLFAFTGFLQAKQIDSKDLNYWNYTEGEISGTGEIYLKGNNEICWILIHSYVSTPLEMRELALIIHEEFNDTVKAIRLKGHGSIPSKLYNISYNDLYLEVEKEFVTLEKQCKNINIVGSSLGGTLAASLAENKELKNLYLVNPYLSITHKAYYGIYPGIYIEYLSRLNYIKKPLIARINNPDTRLNHVAYWNLPYYTLKTTEDILPKVREGAKLITENTLTQHSINDPTADVSASKNFINTISSENKKLVLFEDSHHLLLMDYDSDEVIQNIIEFEKRFRQF